MDITRPNWEFTAISKDMFGGIGVLGDSVGEIAPETATELTESLPAGCCRYVFAGTGKLAAGGQVIDVTTNMLVKMNVDAELVWTLGDDCEALVLASPEYEKPERRAARAIIPIAVGILGSIGVAAVISEGLAGNW